MYIIAPVGVQLLRCLRESSSGWPGYQITLLPRLVALLGYLGKASVKVPYLVVLQVYVWR
jgi:hypothetical protein